jgi:hypothetical protein
LAINTCYIIALQFWLYRIAQSLLAILRQAIAKQAMPFGDHLLLNKAKAI